MAPSCWKHSVQPRVKLGVKQNSFVASQNHPNCRFSNTVQISTSEIRNSIFNLTFFLTFVFNYQQVTKFTKIIIFFAVRLFCFLLLEFFFTTMVFLVFHMGIKPRVVFARMHMFPVDMELIEFAEQHDNHSSLSWKEKFIHKMFSSITLCV